MERKLPEKKNPDRLKTVLDIIETAGRLASSTVIVAGGDRAEDIQLVESARDHGFVDRIVLVGHKTNIHKVVQNLGIEIRPENILHAEGNEEIAARTVQTALDEDIHIVLKGRVPTAVLSREMLKLSNRPTTSLVSMMDVSAVSNGRLFFLSDPAITTVINFGRLTGIIRNAVDVAQMAAGIEKPRVAVLSAYEGVLPSLPSTQLALKLSELNWPDAFVCGPLSFDLATDSEALRIKGMPKLPHAEEVAGRADVLICPNIETGNVLYKCVSAQARFGGASIANIAVGFDVSYGVISRADSLESRLASIALCSVFAQRTRALRKPRPCSAPAGKTQEIFSLEPGKEMIDTAACRIGLPVTELNLICLHGGDNVVLFRVKKGRLVESGKVSLAGEKRRAESAAVVVGDEVRKIVEEEKGLIHAFVFSRKFIRMKDLARSVKKSISHLAPILSFEENSGPYSKFAASGEGSGA
ncbi:MAG: hypothetical protein JXB26_09805 [Candidatus Aminicenantes bacterium]|nr:hypothetical protein [Candidatus Aminicenantes bacterium]